MHPIPAVLIACKFICGLIAIALGVSANDPNLIIFGAGHAFILSPLWILSERIA